MEQQQVQKPSVPVVQTKPVNVSPSVPLQGKSVGVQKSSKWWLWILLGIVIGAAGMWATLSL